MTTHTSEPTTGPDTSIIPGTPTLGTLAPGAAVPGAPAVSGTSVLLFTQVQQFYARQSALLRESRVSEYAATFTEDGVLTCVPAGPRARGRAAVAAALLAVHERRTEGEPVRRRYWQDALEVSELPGGELQARYGMLVTEVRPWQPAAVVGVSAAVEDLLVLDGGELRVCQRRITPDHVSF